MAATAKRRVVKINNRLKEIIERLEASEVNYDGSLWSTPVDNVSDALDYLYSGTTTPAALTKVDDTNVTLTLGGTPATALLQATSITVGWAGQLAIARGGTNASTAAGARVNLLPSLSGNTLKVLRVNAGETDVEWATASGGVSDGDYGDITVSGSGATWTIDNNVVTYAKFQQVTALSLVGNSTNALANAAAITAGSDYQILRRSGTAIGFGAIDLSQSNAVGTSRLAYANITQLAGLSVLGVTGTSTANVAAITGTANQVLVVNGAGTSLAFGQVNLSSPSAVSGTLAEGKGGTGNNTYAIGDLLYASGATTLSKLADVSVGSYLRSGGVTTAPLWSTLKLPNTSTANYVVISTASNTVGESGNLQFNGTNLGISGAGTSKVHIFTPSIAVTQSEANGLNLENSTAAAAGAQQMSPPILWIGQGWKTNATAASQKVAFMADVLPVQAAANPMGTWQLKTSINGAAYANVLTVTSAGVVTPLLSFQTPAGSASAPSHSFTSMTNAGMYTTGTSLAFTASGTIALAIDANRRTISYIDHIVAGTMQAIGTSSAFAVSYRTTNGGTTVTPYVWAGNNSTATAGNRVYALGVSGAAHEGLNFCVGNGTRYISVASIDMTVHDTTAGSEDASLSFYTMAAGALRVENMRISNLGSVVVGAQAALATGATDGFLYIPTCAGTPTGVPTAYTGKVAMIYDTTNNKLYVYNGGWKGGTTPGAFT